MSHMRHKIDFHILILCHLTVKINIFVTMSLFILKTLYNQFHFSLKNALVFNSANVAISAANFIIYLNCLKEL